MPTDRSHGSRGWRIELGAIRPINPGDKCRPSRVPPELQKEPFWQEYLARAAQSRERALAEY